MLAPTIAVMLSGEATAALYSAAAAVLVALVTTAGAVFTQIAARRSPSLPPQALPAADSGIRPVTAPGTVAAYYERALQHAEYELDDERATSAGLRHLLAMARGYIRVLLAFISSAGCGTPPDPPAGLDIDSP